MKRTPTGPIAAEFHQIGRLFFERASKARFRHLGNDPEGGMDCRGFISWWYGAMGLPVQQPAEAAHYSPEYFRNCNGIYLTRLEEQFTRVDQRAAQFGDLVCFRPHDRNIDDVAHTGILEDPVAGTFWHAYRRAGVARNRLAEPYWRDRLFGMMRHDRTDYLNARRSSVPGAMQR